MAGSFDFQQLQSRVLGLHGKGNYREALALALEAEEEFPEKAGKLSYWVACLQCRLGELDEALASLRESVDRGHWLAQQYPDLEPLQGRADFQDYLTRCEELRQDAEATARPDLIVHTPPGYSGSEQHPLLIALHGHGGNAEDFHSHWTEALSAGMILALPQSSQVVGSGYFAWNDRDKAEGEVTSHFEKVRQDYVCDLDRVVLSGYSQGGMLAIGLALKAGIDPCRGFLAVAPMAFPDAEALGSDIEGAVSRGVRGWILIGEADSARSSTESLHQLLIARGLNCQLLVAPETGHSFPPDFSRRLKSGLRFVLSP